jgi:hypothetical protein
VQLRRCIRSNVESQNVEVQSAESRNFEKNAENGEFTLWTLLKTNPQGYPGNNNLVEASL